MRHATHGVQQIGKLGPTTSTGELRHSYRKKSSPDISLFSKHSSPTPLRVIRLQQRCNLDSHRGGAYTSLFLEASKQVFPKIVCAFQSPASHARCAVCKEHFSPDAEPSASISKIPKNHHAAGILDSNPTAHQGCAAFAGTVVRRRHFNATTRYLATARTGDDQYSIALRHRGDHVVLD